MILCQFYRSSWSSVFFLLAIALLAALLFLSHPFRSGIAAASGALPPQGQPSTRPDVLWLSGGHHWGIDGIAYSPDGQVIATTGDYGMIKLWRVSDSKLLRTFRSHTSFVTKIKFSPDSATPDGLVLITCGIDSGDTVNKFKMWRVSDATLLRTITKAGTVSEIALTVLPEGATLIVKGIGTGVSGLELYKISDGTLVRTIPCATYIDNTGMERCIGTYVPGGYLAVSGQVLATDNGQTNANPFLVNLNNGRLISYSSKFGSVHALSGGLIIVSDPGAVLRGYSTSSFCLPLQNPCNDPIPLWSFTESNFTLRFAEFLPDGQKFLLLGSRFDGTTTTISARIYDATFQGFSLSQTLQGINTTAIHFAFSPDSQFIVSGDSNSMKIPLRSVSDGSVVKNFETFTGEVESVVFSRNGQVFATLSEDKTAMSREDVIRFMNVSNGAVISTIKTGNLISPNSSNGQGLALSPDGQLAAITGRPVLSSSVFTRLYRVADGTLLRTINAGDTSVAFSPDGQTLAISGGSSTGFYRVSDGSFITSFAFIGYSTAFSPEGQTLATGGQNGVVRLSQLTNPQIFRNIQTSLTRDVKAVAFSPDGQTLAIAGMTDPNTPTFHGKAELYRVSDGALLHSFTAHQGRDMTLAFSPNGQVLAVGGDDLIIRFYRVSDGTLLQTYDQETGGAATPGNSNILSVAFSTDGGLFGYGRQDGVLVMAFNPFANRIDASPFFVSQHYLDFLHRQADSSGLAFWTNEIMSCGTNVGCIEVKRINVSASFFLSIEFQDTGYLVERIYKTAYGDANGTSTFGGTHTLKVPIVRLNEFLADSQEIGQGVVVLQPGWEQLLENNKNAFTAAFVQRARFASAFPTTLTPAEFVDRLFLNAGVTPSPADRNASIAEFGSATNTGDVAARGRVLRRVAENATLKQQEFNRAFVLMQYFGYLQRNPNDPRDSDYTGYDFWLTKLNQFNGNYIAAEMVKAFITSIEYRQRFGT